jgi:2-dehydro-3-deoxygluconokinase
MKPEVLALVAAREPAVVHVTGITPALSPQCDDLIGRVTGKPRSGSALVSFDVNFRPAVWAERPAAPRLLELAQGADIVFVGLDEAGELWGTSKPADVRRLIGNPRVLVVKDGAAGATAFHAGGAEHVPAPEVSVVEPVGAGDAFAAGWLSGLLRGRTQRDRLRLGHLIASAALASTADCAPLPGSGWLEAALAASEDSWRTVLSAGRALG